ncbi:hypothetical protein ACFO3J_32540 [Streptomyces polygonati]|uniref:Uncharacterized protein n=1 Tax=Streptomyces polygonati TaxID=1617087 RepID=A0ABV8HVQ4_9ACTN
MDSSSKAAVSAAIASGYLLGRTKNAKYAFAIATYVAGRRFSLSPSKLAYEALRHLKENPQLGDLRDKVSGELLAAARSAVTGSADRKLAAMAETLRERNEAAHGAKDKDMDDRENAENQGEEASADPDHELEGAGEEPEDSKAEAVEDKEEDEQESTDTHHLEVRHVPGRSRSERSARQRAPHRDSPDEEDMERLAAQTASERKQSTGQATANKTLAPKKAAAKKSTPMGQKVTFDSSPSPSNRRGR